MPAVAELLRSRPQASAPEDDGEFVIYRDVPVWKEHTNTRDFETPQTFSKDDLQRVSDHCNERIEDTGDYSAIVIRHNRDGQETDPPVVGFAGPFRLGRFGNKEPKWAILADLRIRKEDHELTKRYPRLSVEYWYSADDPKGGYFDPISLLGSETPELDLGIRYGRNAHEGMRRACYSRDSALYEATPTVPGGSNTFIPGHVGAKKKESTYSKENSSMLDEQSLAQIVEALTPVVQEAVAVATQGLGGADDLGGEEMTPYQKACKYAADQDEDGLKEYLGGMDEDQKAKFQADLDGEEDPERASYMAGAMGKKPEPAMATYAKQNGDLKLENAKYKRENGELRAKYAKLEAEVKELRQVEVKSARYQKLQGLLDDGYEFEIQDELDDTVDLSPEQFDKHCARIVKRYQKLPGGVLAVGKPEVYVPAGPSEEQQAKSAKYSKRAQELVTQARDNKQDLSFETALEQAKREDKAA